jgi:LacI family transcriptional regulator
MSTVKERTGSKNGLIRKPRQKRVLIFADWREEDMMNAITTEAMRLDWQIVDVLFLHNRSATNFNPDGVLSCRQDMPAFMPDLQKRGVPAVRIWRMPKYYPDTAIPTVGYDAKAIGRLVANHFLERGFRQVCRLSWHNEGPEDQISKSLAEHLEAEGARYLGETHLPALEGQGWGAFNKAFRKWLAAMPIPLGVLTSGDVLGGHVVAACEDHHVAVPEEIAVMGLGNKRRWCRMSPVPLSSLDWNDALRGREAVHLLHGMMNGNPPPREPILIAPTGVVTRKSTDILAVEDVAVARAISFLWQHMSEPISINDAAHAAGISRSTLERRFRKQIGRSVNDELLRKRLERCRELLLSTKLPMADIAPQIGFLSKNYLHRAFRKHFDCSPKEFRHRQRDGIN